MTIHLNQPTDEEDGGYPFPKYSDPGRIMFAVDTSPPDLLGRAYDIAYELVVIDYDEMTCVHWINEAEGFEYWLLHQLHNDLPHMDGLYVVEGIVGHYHRGDSSYGEDDTVTWKYDRVRPATDTEQFYEFLGADKLVIHPPTLVNLCYPDDDMGDPSMGEIIRHTVMWIAAIGSLAGATCGGVMLLAMLLATIYGIDLWR